MSLVGMLNSNDKYGNELRRIINLLNINPTNLLYQSVENKNNPDKDIKAKYLLKDHSLASQLGTAFDYLARFVIKKYQYRITKENPKESYVADIGLEELLKRTKNKNNHYKEHYLTALELINDFITGNDSESLNKRIIGISSYFAKLEMIYRNGYSENIEESLRFKIDKYVEQELLNQIAILEDEFQKKFGFKTKECNIEYNPAFGICSYAIGGADADIIIDKTLINFKTSKYITRNINKNFQQIIGYYLFSNISHKHYEINSICLYFARYGKFIEYKFTKKDEKNIELATEQMRKFIDNLLKIYH